MHWVCIVELQYILYCRVAGGKICQTLTLRSDIPSTFFLGFITKGTAGAGVVGADEEENFSKLFCLPGGSRSHHTQSCQLIEQKLPVMFRAKLTRWHADTWLPTPQQLQWPRDDNAGRHHHSPTIPVSQIRKRGIIKEAAGVRWVKLMLLSN